MEEFIIRLEAELDKLPSNTIMTAKLMKAIIKKSKESEEIGESEENLTFDEMLHQEF